MFNKWIMARQADKKVKTQGISTLTMQMLKTFLKKGDYKTTMYIWLLKHKMFQDDIFILFHIVSYCSLFFSCNI